MGYVVPRLRTSWFRACGLYVSAAVDYMVPRLQAMWLCSRKVMWFATHWISRFLAQSDRPLPLRL